nr:MAG: hypothetical protein [Lake Baikal virophage 11]
MSDFISNLQKELVEKKSIAPTTADSYVRTLVVLNNKAPFKNLGFLKKTDDILAKLDGYADTTQKSILAILVSVLGMIPSYKKAYTVYHQKMVEAMKEAEENHTTEKTSKQKENWIDWNVIKKMSDDAYTKIKTYKNTLTSKELDHLLNTTILSLYTCIQPRRNQDYLDMLVVKKWNDKMPTDKNYLDLSNSQFIFNKYKTSKKYGTQIVKIPNDEKNPLMDILEVYLKHHPQFKMLKGKNSEPIPFLVGSTGTLTAANSITRILNKVFGKKVGSSMLRHSFLTSKYGDIIQEQQEDAAAMGHDIEMQRDYVKT